MLDLLLAIAIGVGTGVLVAMTRYLARSVDVNTVKRLGSPLTLLVGGAAVGLLAQGADLLGANSQDVLFSGQTSLSTIVAEDSAKIVLVLLVAKGLAYAICLGCGFRGGPVFPAIFLGVGLAALAIIVLDVSPTLAVAVGAAAGVRGDDAPAADLDPPRDAPGRLERTGRGARGGAGCRRGLADGHGARRSRGNPRRRRHGHRSVGALTMARAITVRCTACGEGRPVSPDPCPACGADAYRHKTADAGEFWEMIAEAQQHDRPELGDGMAPFG